MTAADVLLLNLLMEVLKIYGVDNFIRNGFDSSHRHKLLFVVLLLFLFLRFHWCKFKVHQVAGIVLFWHYYLFLSIFLGF